MELRILVPQGQPGLAVAAIPCLDDRKGNLDVLLRHRPAVSRGPGKGAIPAPVGTTVPGSDLRLATRVPLRAFRPVFGSIRQWPPHARRLRARATTPAVDNPA